MKWAMGENARNACGSMRVGGMNSKSALVESVALMGFGEATTWEEG